MMTIHIPSLVLGCVLSYVLAAVLLILICAFAWRQEKKERERALDQLLAEVGIACIERPTDVREN